MSTVSLHHATNDSESPMDFVADRMEKYVKWENKPFQHSLNIHHMSLTS